MGEGAAENRGGVTKIPRDPAVTNPPSPPTRPGPGPAPSTLRTAAAAAAALNRFSPRRSG